MGQRLRDTARDYGVVDMMRPGELHAAKTQHDLKPQSPPISQRKLRGRRAAIIGSVGLPARYGGFETMADQLVRQAARRGFAEQLSVWCTSQGAGANRPTHHHGARLRYLPLAANGAASIPYDGISAWTEVFGRHGADTLLALGVSGGGPLAALRPLTGKRLVVNIDGREAERGKWGGVASRVLRWSEVRAVRAADVLVADNAALADDVTERYGIRPRVIAYGGDHALSAPVADISDLGLPATYALAIARAEPENNLEILIHACSKNLNQPLVIVANWSETKHGRKLRAAWDGTPNLHMVEAEYDPGRLHAIRRRAWVYLHGHSAGGTNPSLVEMMGFSVPIVTWDCKFNRTTTAGTAPCFRDVESLATLINRLSTRPELREAMGMALKAVGARRYRWEAIADAYFDVLDL